MFKDSLRVLWLHCRIRIVFQSAFRSVNGNMIKEDRVSFLMLYIEESKAFELLF